jgi:hypothetical protein
MRPDIPTTQKRSPWTTRPHGPDVAGLATQRTASDKLYQIKDHAFEYAGVRLSAGESLKEYELQERMTAWFAEPGLITDAALTQPRSRDDS